MIITIVLFGSLFILCGFAVAGVMGAPWIPAFRKDVEPILDDLEIKSGMVVIDLGCGDGRFVRAAAKRGARSFGYEINPVMFLIARLRNLGLRNAKICYGNLWQQPLKQADAVIVFIMPQHMAKLEAKLKREAKQGCLVGIYIYQLPGLKPKKFDHNTYIYKF